MAKKKISISEALQVLREHNLDVSVKPIVQEEIPFERRPIGVGRKGVVRKVGNTAITITLRSQHIIGSGGFLVMKDGEQVAQDNTSKTYGPGVVTVPVAIADHLLHQDQLATQADERFLSREERSYLIVKKRGPDGSVANVGVQVDDSLMGNFNLNLKETMVI